jgi:beta-galactosidase GanA
MKLGVCYYPEHWPQERWPEDARLMRKIGLSLVRIADFAWVAIEPREGEFTWDWLDQAVGVLAAEGLQDCSLHTDGLPTSLALPGLSGNSSGGCPGPPTPLRIAPPLLP